MALNPDVCGVIDPSIPQWKRELIIRRRALGRTLQVGSSSVKLTCPAVVAAVRQPELCSGSENISTNSQKCSPTAEDSSFGSFNQNRVDFHPGPSLAGSGSNMRLLDACSEVDNLVINNGIDVKLKQSGVVTNNSDTSVNYSLIMGQDSSPNLKKSPPRPKQENNNCSISTRQRFFIDKVKSEGTNGKSRIKDDDCLSDSSEELQYGPGIVKKLKTKYLSMTLREQKRNVRPSLSNLRRATSLENMLEGDDSLNEQNKLVTEVKVRTENVNLNDITTSLGKTVGLNSHRGVRSLGTHRKETMKRAQSMDTLLKSEVRGTLKPIVNENIIIVEKENLGTNPSDSTRLRRDVNTELPPPDLVKQTLKIFETSPKRKVKPAGQGNLAKLVAGFSNPAIQPVSSISNKSIIDRRKVNQNNKPTLSPKPVLSPEKLRRTKMGSPKRNQPLATNSIVTTASKTLALSNSNRPVGINSDREKPQYVPSEQSVTEKNTVTSPKVLSPRSISPIVKVLTNNDHPSFLPQSSEKINHQNSFINSEKEVTSVYSDVEEVDGHTESSKPVPETALENIRQGGVSMQFSFNSESSPSLRNKSYLPRPKSPPQALNTSLKEKLEKSPPPTSFVSPRQQGSPQTKQVGIIRPLVSTKIQPSSTPALTEQEIEKNLINRVKSIEQPVSKVVVAIKSLPDNVVLGSVSADVVTNKSLTLSQGCANSKVKSQGLWDEKVWHANQNTIVFNFSNRKEVPDYIENDGLILKGKRDRPRPGDGGYILLEGSSEDADETSTEAEDLLTSSPPSPCDVTFVGDNVLINGKSNLKKSPKQVKLRIQFNDEATTMFEYPSEASLVEEETRDGCRERDEGDAAQASSTTASTSTSTSGTPGLSMSLGIPPPDFLPPPVPSRPLPPPPVDQCPPLPPVGKGRAPQPPAGLLTPAGPTVPPRLPPRLFKSNSLDVVSHSSKNPNTNLSSTKGRNDKYFSKKKVRNPSKPTVETAFGIEDQLVKSAITNSETPLTEQSYPSKNQTGSKMPDPVIKVTELVQPEVAFSRPHQPESSNILKSETFSFTAPNKNANLNLVKTYNFKNTQTQSEQYQSENPSSNLPEVINVSNYELNGNRVSLGNAVDQKKEQQSSSEESQQSCGKVLDHVLVHTTMEKNLNQHSDENANDFSTLKQNSQHPSDVLNLGFEKFTDNKLPYTTNKTEAPTKPSLDLKSKLKPVKVVQPLMGTKSLTTTLLSPNLESAPKYCPVYSKPSLVYSNSELTVDPLLSQVLTQKKIPSPTFVNRSVSTRKFLVLEDWPLGTESLV